MSPRYRSHRRSVLALAPARMVECRGRKRYRKLIAMSQLVVASNNPARSCPLRAHVAHDLRNLLATVGLHLETLQRLSGPSGARPLVFGARAWAARRDPKKRAAGSGGSKCETGRCPGRWLDASINDLETLTRSYAAWTTQARLNFARKAAEVLRCRELTAMCHIRTFAPTMFSRCSGSDTRINEPGKRAEPVLKIPSAFRSPLAQTSDRHQHTHP